MSQPSDLTWHGTTILSLRKDGKVVIAGDGQVTFGKTVIKSNARKVRRLGNGERASPASPAPPPMPSRCSSGWRPSWSSIRASSPAPASSWPRTGAPTAICAGSRR